jgi:hypothetical protein
MLTLPMRQEHTRQCHLLLAGKGSVVYVDWFRELHSPFGFLSRPNLWQLSQSHYLPCFDGLNVLLL